jgi:hypothetical protein
MQAKQDFGYALASASGSSVLHVVQITGDYYGAFSSSAICGTTPRARWSMHTGWFQSSQHETLQAAAAAGAVGSRLCQRCFKKAAQLQARAEKLAADLQALEEETAAEAALDAEALAAVAAEADPTTEAGQAWLAAYEAAEQQQQAEAIAASLARADALGITAEAAAAAEQQRQAEALAAVTAALPTAEESRQAAVSAYLADHPAEPVPCQCEHANCTHDYLAVPAGNAAAMFIGPICDDCVSHMQGYLLQGTEAEASSAEVRTMYRQQAEAAAELAAAEPAGDPADPMTWAGNSSHWQDSCPASSAGEWHYVVQGSCWTCDLSRLQRLQHAEAASAEALAEFPSVERFAISAHVYLADRGYAVVRTISRNISRADLPEALAGLAEQGNLSKLTAYPDLFG